jgi:integrase
MPARRRAALTRREEIARLRAELRRLEAAEAAEATGEPREVKHRVRHRLTDRVIAARKTPGFLADGGNLYLDYKDPPSKNWVFRFGHQGNRHDMGLGPYPDVSLAAARELAEDARRKLRAKINPLAERQAARAAGRVASVKVVTFRECAQRYIAAHEAGWKNPKHAAQWPATLEAYAYPVFGDLPITAIDTGLVLKAIEPIWQIKTETASRLRGRIEVVISWATVRGYRPAGDNPARWKGHLDQLLPKKSKVASTRHHPALPYPELSDFMARLAQQDGLGALALQLVILTCLRTSEALGGRWAEIDLERKLWTIPAQRMKVKTRGDGSPAPDHRIPLSAPALAILGKLPRLEGSPFLFPAGRGRAPVSNMIMLQLLRRMGRADLTVHGFRSSFRDWAAETTNHPREAAELALAHSVGSEVEQSYRRGDMFQKRRVLMDDWARHCSTPRPTEGGMVVPLVRHSESA